EEANVPANIRWGDVDDGVHTSVFCGFELVDDFGDEVRTPTEKLRPHLQETRGAGVDVLVGQGEAELRSIEWALHSLHDAGSSPRRCRLAERTSVFRAGGADCRAGDRSSGCLR